MTRNEFLNEITTWSDLLNFCYDNDCYECDNIISDDDLDSRVDDDIADAIREYNWTDVRDWLSNIDTSACYYKHEGILEFEPVDDDFDIYLRNVLEWADDNDIFDEEEEQEEDLSNDDEPNIPDASDYAVGDLISHCNSQFHTILSEREAERKAEAEAEDARVSAFLCSC